MKHTTPPPQIRAASPTDIDAIGQIEAAVFAADPYPPFFFRQALALWPHLLLVAEADGELVGYALGGLGEDRHQGWLLSLAVIPAARSMGVAAKMLTTLAQILASQQVATLRLTVEPSNPAQQLYVRLGYRYIAAEPDYFGIGQTRLLLEKRLIGTDMNHESL